MWVCFVRALKTFAGTQTFCWVSQWGLDSVSSTQCCTGNELFTTWFLHDAFVSAIDLGLWIRTVTGAQLLNTWQLNSRRQTQRIKPEKTEQDKCITDWIQPSALLHLCALHTLTDKAQVKIYECVSSNIICFEHYWINCQTLVKYERNASVNQPYL